METGALTTQWAEADIGSLLFPVGSRVFDHVAAWVVVTVRHRSLGRSMVGMGGRILESLTRNRLGLGQSLETRYLDGSARFLDLWQVCI